MRQYEGDWEDASIGTALKWTVLFLIGCIVVGVTALFFISHGGGSGPGCNYENAAAGGSC